MIINSANKFVENISWWISFFNIIFWVIALSPLGMLGFFIMVAGPPRRGDEFVFLMIGIVVYIGAALVVHRLTLIGFHFMKAIVSSAIECQQELKQIKEALKQKGDDPDIHSPAPKPSPFNY